MSGSNPPGSPPPEVPEEFAAAYRAAYEQALAAQTVGAKHREDFQEPDEDVAESPDDDADDGAEVDTEEDADDGVVDELDLPVRRGPIRVGTHRTEEEYDDAPTWFERVRDSHWFVPLLLVLLALLLIFSAYAVGRRFADQVDDADAVSRIIVTGPSLASSTVMSAPNTPRSTRVPSSSSPSHTAS